MQIFNIGAVAVVPLTNGHEESVSSVVVQVKGITADSGSMTPQRRIFMDGDNTTPPSWINTTYINQATGAVVAAGTAITADGEYEFSANGSTIAMNVTTVTAGWQCFVKPLEGPSGMSSGSGGGGGAVTIADGADVTLGAIADAAVGDAAGTVNAHLRQIAKSLAAGGGAGPVSVIVQDPTLSFTQPTGDAAARAIFTQTTGEVATGATGAAIPPLIIGGLDTSSNVQPLPIVLATSTPTGTGVNTVPTFSVLVGNSSANVLRALVTATGFSPGGSAANTLTVVPCRAVTSTTYEQAYNNLNVTLLSSSARTTTQTSADQTNFNHAKLIVVLDVTAGTTPALTLTIDGKDSASGKFYNLLTSASVSTVSTNVYTIAVGMTPAANVTVSAFVPRLFRIVVTAGNGNSITYSVGYSLVV